MRTRLLTPALAAVLALTGQSANGVSSASVNVLDFSVVVRDLNPDDGIGPGISDYPQDGGVLSLAHVLVVDRDSNESTENFASDILTPFERYNTPFRTDFGAEFVDGVFLQRGFGMNAPALQKRGVWAEVTSTGAAGSTGSVSGFFSARTSAIVYAPFSISPFTEVTFSGTAVLAASFDALTRPDPNVVSGRMDEHVEATLDMSLWASRSGIEGRSRIQGPQLTLSFSDLSAGPQNGTLVQQFSLTFANTSADEAHFAPEFHASVSGTGLCSRPSTVASARRAMKTAVSAAAGWFHG
jgi:hypothetical protein